MKIWAQQRGRFCATGRAAAATALSGQHQHHHKSTFLAFCGPILRPANIHGGPAKLASALLPHARHSILAADPATLAPHRSHYQRDGSGIWFSRTLWHSIMLSPNTARVQSIQVQLAQEISRRSGGWPLKAKTLFDNKSNHKSAIFNVRSLDLVRIFKRAPRQREQNAKQRSPSRCGSCG